MSKYVDVVIKVREHEGDMRTSTNMYASIANLHKVSKEKVIEEARD